MTEPQQSTPSNPGRRAVLIGINKYPKLPAIHNLRGCVNDILDMRRFLVEQAGFPAANVRLLLSELDDRKLPNELGSVGQPDSQGMRQALASVSEGIQPGDEVVIYYSGHGVRVRNPNNSREQIGALAASDIFFDRGALAPQALVVNRELNQAIQSLLSAGATVTVVLDACHSGGATRGDLEESANLARELAGEVTAEGWQQLVSQHGLTGDVLAAETARGLDSGGWVTSMTNQQNLIVLSGCRDIETSKEFPRDTRRNGCLSYFLIDSLKNVKAEETGSITWQSLYPRLRQAVNGAYADQTPTLEGRGERPLFGGQWRPYDPGFTVKVTPNSGALQLNGGSIHGLDQGAQVGIYPPGTSDFATASQQAVAEVDTADLITSRAHVTSGGAAVADGSRAKLLRPAARAAPLRVRLTDVPADIAQGLQQAPELGDFVTVAPDQGVADFEVRPAASGGGWALVPFTLQAGAPQPNDVIAHLPAPGLDDATALGTALGLGLVHWAKYWAILNRRNTDQALGNAVSLTLLAGSNEQAMLQNPHDPNVARPVSPNAAGVCEVTTADHLMLKVAISPTAPDKLTVGVIVCSNDGNILPLWPPANAESNMAQGEEKVIGYGSDLRPFSLTGGRDDQTQSLYTFKAFATNATTAIDLSSLEQSQTVQDVINAALPSRGGLKGGFGSGVATPRLLWTTVELPVVVKKAG